MMRSLSLFFALATVGTAVQGLNILITVSACPNQVKYC